MQLIKKNFNEFCDKRDLDKKKRIALRLAINNVINGKFEYSEIKVKEILNDISVDKQFADVYSVDEIKLNLKETKRKSIIFLISTAITNAIIWDGISQAFWLSLLTQGMLILTSTISATMIANQRIATLSMVAFEDVWSNRKPVSFTHVRQNNEHIDIKDIRFT